MILRTTLLYSKIEVLELSEPLYWSHRNLKKGYEKAQGKSDAFPEAAWKLDYDVGTSLSDLQNLILGLVGLAQCILSIGHVTLILKVLVGHFTITIG